MDRLSRHPRRRPGSLASAAVVVVAGLVGAAALLMREVSPAPVLPGGDWQSASVVRVVDGDSLVVSVDGREERLRLIGIDAPETGDCFAVEATEALEDLLGNSPVRLETDSSDRDRFDRLLRYVHTDGVHVNLHLVEEGFAIARRYPPDTRHAVTLEEAEGRARSAGRGIWGWCDR